MRHTVVFRTRYGKYRECFLEKAPTSAAEKHAQGFNKLTLGLVGTGVYELFVDRYVLFPGVTVHILCGGCASESIPTRTHPSEGACWIIVEPIEVQ